MAHVAKWKHNEIKQLTEVIAKNKVVGLVDIGGIPAPQMQQMRSNLHGKAVIRSSKNSLILRALDESEKQMKGISDLKEKLDGQTAIISTSMNPFKLFNEIKKSRTMAPAKGGETADYDIEVKQGDTPFKPGPIVGDLQKVGIPAAIQKGKVVIKKDKVIVPEGEKISRDVAQMLTRLEIHPVEIGMNLQAVFEEGTIFTPDILDVDIDEIIGNMKTAFSNAHALSMETAWVTKDNICPLLIKAYQNAFTLALEKQILNKETIDKLLSNADAQRQVLADILEQKQPKKENN